MQAGDSGEAYIPRQGVTPPSPELMQVVPSALMPEKSQCNDSVQMAEHLTGYLPTVITKPRISLLVKSLADCTAHIPPIQFYP